MSFVKKEKQLKGDYENDLKSKSKKEYRKRANSLQK